MNIGKAVLQFEKCQVEFHARHKGAHLLANGGSLVDPAGFEGCSYLKQNTILGVVKFLSDTVSCAGAELAGAGGLEPPNGGTKNRCLTTWLRPNRGKG